MAQREAAERRAQRQQRLGQKRGSTPRPTVSSPAMKAASAAPMRNSPARSGA
jgi:hypothetical protein